MRITDKLRRDGSTFHCRIFTLATLAAISFQSATLAAAQEPRFGDSTWVAPVVPDPALIAPDGPRVAEPDRERAWETALRAPFRLAFLPLRLVGRGLEFGVGKLGPRFLEPKEKPATYGPKLGLRVDLNEVTTGFEDIGLGPEVSWVPEPDVRIRASAAFSIKDRRRGRFISNIHSERKLGALIDAEYDFKPDRSFFGIGNDTEQDDRAFYRLENNRLDATVRYGLTPFNRARLMLGYSGMSPGEGEHRGPLLDETFPRGTVPFGHSATHYMVPGIGLDVARVNNWKSPSLGAHGRVEFRRYVGLSDNDPDYNQWVLEARGYLPVFAARRVLAIRGTWTGVDPVDDESPFPFYRLAQSERNFRFLGYSTQRFRDRQLMIGQVEYRWLVSHLVSAVAIYQVGAVAPDRQHFRLDDVHTSWGGGLRTGRADGTTIRLDVGKSVEGWKAGLRIRNDF
jgi:hypothetical protein